MSSPTLFYFCKPVLAELLLHNAVELDSNDDFLNGPHDELHISGSYIDSSLVTKDAQGQVNPDFRPLNVPDMDLLGDIADGKNYEDGRPEFPLTLIRHELNGPSAYPRRIAAYFNPIESDNDSAILSELKKLDTEYRQQLVKLLTSKLKDIAKSELGSAAEAVADAVAGLMNAVVGGLVDALLEPVLIGLENDKMRPFTLDLALPGPWHAFGQEPSLTPVVSSGVQMLDYWGGRGDAHYLFYYEWRIHRTFEHKFLRPTREITRAGARRPPGV